MRRLVDEHLWPFLKFGMVGVVNTVVYYGVYLLLHERMPYLLAHGLGWVVGLAVSFLLNCWFTYAVRPTWRRALLFPLSSLPNIVMTTIGIVVLVEWVGLGTTVAPLVATLVAVPLSFLISRVLLTGPLSGSDARPRVDDPPSAVKRDRRSV